MSVHAQPLSSVQLFVTLWTIAHQVPLFSARILESFPPLEDLRDLGSNPHLLHLLLWQADSLPLNHLGSPYLMGLSRQEWWNGLPFPSPVDHVLYELSTMTRLSWVALHSTAHSVTELDKVVIHVISLLSFLWLWFSFCLPSEGWE